MEITIHRGSRAIGGDFRASGPHKKAFGHFLADPPRDVDALLMEGTMMGRDNGRFPDEKTVEDKMLDVLRNLGDRACFLSSSGRHVKGNRISLRRFRVNAENVIGTVFHEARRRRTK